MDLLQDGHLHDAGSSNALRLRRCTFHHHHGRWAEAAMRAKLATTGPAADRVAHIQTFPRSDMSQVLALAHVRESAR